MPNARTLLDCQPNDHRRGIVGKCWIADLVVDETQLWFLAQTQDGLDHIRAVIPTDPRNAHDGVGCAKCALAGKLGFAVHTCWVWNVGLYVWRSFGSVKHIVGRDVHNVRANGVRSRSDVCGCRSVNKHGLVWVALASVNSGPCSGVNYNVWFSLTDRGVYSLLVRDVEAFVR